MGEVESARWRFWDLALFWDSWLAGFRDTADAGVVGEDQVTGLLGFGFEVGAVAGDEEPVLWITPPRMPMVRKDGSFVRRDLGLLVRASAGFCLFGED